jgi:hypothetical protein
MTGIHSKRHTGYKAKNPEGDGILETEKAGSRGEQNLKAQPLSDPKGRQFGKARRGMKIERSGCAAGKENPRRTKGQERTWPAKGEISGGWAKDRPRLKCPEAGPKIRAGGFDSNG